MAAPLVLFVPGYPEAGTSAALAQRFAHALCTGGAGQPVLLPDGAYDATSFAEHFEPARFPAAGSGQLPPLVGDAQQFFAEVHQSILESNPATLRAPAERARRDPFVAHLDDPDIGALRVFFSMLHDYSTNAELRYALQAKVQDAVARHARRSILVVAHGLGGVVAYDALFKLGPNSPPVQLLTLGTPLGLRVTQRRLKAKARADSRYPIPERVLTWVNLSAAADPVSADPTLGDEFRWSDDARRIDDRAAQVDTGWPFHRWEGYVRSAAARTAVGEFLRRNG